MWPIKDIDDSRESPSLEFMNISKKIVCDYHDPFVKYLNQKLKKTYKSKNLSIKMLKKYDLTYILTDHEKIDFKKIKNILSVSLTLEIDLIQKVQIF